MPDVLEPPAIKPKHFDNPEFARQAGLKSAALAKARREAQLPCPTAFQPVPLCAPTTLLDEFATRRLIRVREQLERLDALASIETDPKRLKELADASARLSAQEFDLAGRPKSGTTKPENKPKRTTGHGTAPVWQVEAQAVPVSEAMPQAVPMPKASAQPAPANGNEYDPVLSQAGYEYDNQTGINSSVEQ